jgi:hypothetical protein
MTTTKVLRTRTSRFWVRRVGWLLLLWGAGVAALSVVAALLHVLMRAAGMR